MEMVKLEIRDMLFETDPATAVAKRHKRSKTVSSQQGPREQEPQYNMNKKLPTTDMLFYQLTQK